MSADDQIKYQAERVCYLKTAKYGDLSSRRIDLTERKEILLKNVLLTIVKS